MGLGTVRQCVACIICQLSVMVVGTAFCCSEPIFLRKTWDAGEESTSGAVSWLFSIADFVGIIGPLISGFLIDRIGRKLVIMSIGPFCFAGWILFLLSKSLLSLILVRILFRLAMVVAYTVTTIYSAEVAEPKLRGRLSGIFEITWSLGFLYYKFVSDGLSDVMFACTCLPLPVVFTVMWIFVPESPYYLLMTNREDEAKRFLKYIRDSNIEKEMEDMKSSVRERKSAGGSWKTLFCDKIERKSLVIMLIVAIAKYLTGLSYFFNYVIYDSESYLPGKSVIMYYAEVAIILGAISAFLSDWIGRKPLVLVSCFGCFVAHLLASGYYIIEEETTIDRNYFMWTTNIGLTIYVIFVGVGVGPLLQTLQSEMFGLGTRGIAAGTIEGFVGILVLAINKLSTPGHKTRWVYVNFLFFSLVGLVCGIILNELMYETSGKKIGQTLGRTPKKRELESVRTLED